MEEEDLARFWKQRGLEVGCREEAHQARLHWQEREQANSNLAQQVTRLTCEQAKLHHTIKTLQDKLTQLAPSHANTSTQFMLASQFRTAFETVMTSHLPLALGSLLDRPFLFSKCASLVFLSAYESVGRWLSETLDSIAQILGLKPREDLHVRSQLKVALIRVLQEHWRDIVPFQATEPLEFEDGQGRVQGEVLRELNEVVGEEDFSQLRTEVHTLAVYMQLQEKEWEFVGLDQGTLKSYCKKEQICLDGWVKEGEEALEVLQGITKDGHLHANLKHFVIPFSPSEDSHLTYAGLKLRPKQTPLLGALPSERSQEEQEKEKNLSIQEVHLVDNEVSQQQEQDKSMLAKNKSAEFSKDKENNPLLLNKKKKKDRAKPSLENSLQAEKSPKSRRKKDDSKSKRLDFEEPPWLIEDKIQILKEELFAKKKKTVCLANRQPDTSHQVPFQDLSMLIRKRVQDLPVSKEVPRKKTKAATSRKNSVGKIVHQELRDKENWPSGNIKGRNKEKAYKDIIKEKLLEDKLGERGPPFCPARGKIERRKEESRPLKIQPNASKLREKYIN